MFKAYIEDKHGTKEWLKHLLVNDQEYKLRT